jgi:hypothetical protein
MVESVGQGGEGSILKEHVHAPAQDHAEGEDEEEAAGLFDGHDGVEVAAGGEADGGEDNDDEEKGLGALHHNNVAIAVEARGTQERPGQDDGAYEESGEGPCPGNAKNRHDKHGEACCHARRGDQDFFEGHGSLTFADPPDENGDSTENGCDYRSEGGYVHVYLNNDAAAGGNDLSAMGGAAWRSLSFKDTAMGKG